MVIEVQEGTPVPTPRDVALVVDLDGTLTLTDTLHEGLFKHLKAHPFDVLRLPAWLGAGKARFKREIAARAPLDVALLPYNQLVLERVREARAAGRRTVLATASDTAVAHAIAEHLGLFDEVIASGDGINLSGANKRDALVERFESHGFDYMANSPVRAGARCRSDEWPRPGRNPVARRWIFRLADRGGAALSMGQEYPHLRPHAGSATI